MPEGLGGVSEPCLLVQNIGTQTTQSDISSLYLETDYIYSNTL
jgi:hypothetical protein